MSDASRVIDGVSTGSGGGIGFGLAVRLLEESKHVLLGIRLAKKRNAALSDLHSRNLPGVIEVLNVDVADQASTTAAANAVESKYGR